MKANVLVLALLSLAAVNVRAADTMWLIPEEEQVRTWNQFVKDVYALHQARIAKIDVEQSEEIGSYYLYHDYYREVIYKDKKSGRVLSDIKWERGANPERIHTIEVYIHDKQGRRIRDYAAMYLPWGRNSPIQTLVGFYDYQPKLYAFRKFDASGRRVYEECRGDFAGKPVEFGLDEFAMAREAETTMKGAAYRACFKNLPEVAGKYLTPQ